MSTYDMAPPEVVAMVGEVMRAHHPELRDADVRVGVLMAYGPCDAETGEVTGPAIRHGGYIAAACIRITQPRERALGMADAVMTLDGDRWEDWALETQRAIIDHELTHLSTTDKEDDHDRPRLKMRLHDQQFGWFDSVAQRHGEASLEIQQARTLAGQAGQLYFGFAEAAVTTMLRSVGRAAVGAEAGPRVEAPQSSETPRRRGRPAVVRAVVGEDGGGSGGAL